MLRVAVVDDEVEARAELCAMVQRFSEERGKAILISEYANGKDLLSSGVAEDIILLDIEMDEVNGMDTARLLRRAGVASEIIFVTNMGRYAIKGYEVGALDFLLKPVRYASFSVKFSRAVEVVARKMNSRIAVTTRDGVRYVNTSEITYVEVMGHKLTYHGTKGSFEAWGTLREARAVLEPFGFALCNACYLVNLARVIAVFQDMVTVEGGDKLKMSRGRKKSFMDALSRPVGG